jgi:hypothetical protein
MKQSIILWIGAFVIAFLFGFWNRFSSPEYPVTGSFGINMKSVTYKFDKVYRGNDNYKIVIKTELDSLNGKIFWRRLNNNSPWHEGKMIFANGTLSGEIPNQQPLTFVEYKVKLRQNQEINNLPKNGNITLKFLAKVPSSIMGFYYFTLFFGLMFSIRTGLDYFNENQRIKKLSLFTIMIWIANVMVFNPVKHSYELSTKIGTKVLPISALFDISHLILLLIWLLGIILIFNSKKYKKWAVVIAVAELIAFLFVV